MKFIKDVDTGEIFPVPDNVEEQINDEMPTLYKDDAVPIMKVDYSGVDGVNDLMLQMTNELEEEERKTVYHKFPFAKIIATIAACVVLVISCTFGIRYILSTDFKTISISTETSNETSSEISTGKSMENSAIDVGESSKEETQDGIVDNFTNALIIIFIAVVSSLLAIASFAIVKLIMYGY